MEHKYDVDILDNTKTALNECCRMLYNKEFCSEDDCEFCPMQNAYEMLEPLEKEEEDE